MHFNLSLPFGSCRKSWQSTRPWGRATPVSIAGTAVVAVLSKNFYNTEMTHKKPLSRRWCELCLNNTRPRPARLLPRKFSLNQEYETLTLIQKAARDKKLDGILLNASGFQASGEYLWELRRALEHCKSGGKKIAAYFDNEDFALYSLVSVTAPGDYLNQMVYRDFAPLA
jgi:hypothetical protein